MDRAQQLLKRAAALPAPRPGRRARRAAVRVWHDFEPAVAALLKKGHDLATIATWMLDQEGKKAAYKSPAWWSAYKAAARHKRRIEREAAAA